jgi:hypothetical protein
MVEQGRVARLFTSLANAVLDMGLPRIRAWLRERVGPSADVARVTSEGALIHLEEARIPIGPRGLLVLDRATLAVASPVRAASTPAIHLASFEGTLTFGAEGERRFVAPVSFEAKRDAESVAWISGTLHVRGATWTAAAGREAEQAPLDGEATLIVTSERWALTHGALTTGRVHIDFRGAGSLEGGGRDALEHAILELSGARCGHFIDVIAALTGAPLDARLPLLSALWEARLDGTVAVSADKSAHCELALEGTALRGTLRGKLGGDEQLDAHLDARIHPAPILAAQRVPARFLPGADDAIELAVRASGTLKEPVLSSTFRSDALRMRFGRARFLPPLVATIRGDVAYERGALRGSVALTANGAPMIGAGLEIVAPNAIAKLTIGGTPTAPTLAGEASAPSLRIVRAAQVGVEPWDFASPKVHVELARDRLVIRDIVTKRSHLRGELRWSKGVFDGSRMAGTIAAADLFAIGLFQTALRPSADDVAHVDATLDGAAGALVLAGRATADRLTIVMPHLAKAPALALGDVRGLFYVDSHVAAWNAVTARGYGGVLSSHGAVGSRDSFAGLRARIQIDDVDLAQVPVQASDAGVRVAGEHVRGRLDGELVFGRDSAAPLAGRGHLRVRSPDYPALARLAPKLEKYSLPAPDARGDRDLVAAVAYAEPGWTFEPIDAKIPACKARGRVFLGAGRIDGAFDLSVARSFLSKSPLLALPLVFSEALDVPLRISGPLEKPIVEADLSFTDVLFHAVKSRPPRADAPVAIADDAGATLALVSRVADWNAIESRLTRVRVADVSGDRPRPSSPKEAR